MQRDSYGNHKVGRPSHETDGIEQTPRFRTDFDSQQEDEDRICEDVDEGQSSEDECDVSTIVALRKRMGLTQAAFAEKFHIPAQTYAQWESFKRTPPGYVLTLLKDACEREMEDMKNLPFTNGENINGFVYDELGNMECPVRLLGETAKLINAPDELGMPTYYLAVGHVNPADVGLMKYWLSALEDPDIKDMLENGFSPDFDFKEYWRSRYQDDCTSMFHDPKLHAGRAFRSMSCQVDPNELGL